jgi:hypothetical protein
MRKFYYVVDIEVDDYGDDVLECTGSKLVTIYEIIDNEPKQLTLIGLSLEDDSEQESQDYLYRTFEGEIFELIRL